jgi:hypothetical protein
MRESNFNLILKMYKHGTNLQFNQMTIYVTQ